VPNSAGFVKGSRIRPERTASEPWYDRPMRNQSSSVRSVVAVVATLAAAAAFVGAERQASAQSALRFGEKGQFAITAEDIFGYRNGTVTDHDPGGNVHDTSSAFGFGFHTQGGDLVVAPGAKAGFHYFLIHGLSLGGSIGFESRGGEAPCGGGNYCDKPGGSSFVFLPRVGYALMISDLLGFWFRGGPGYLKDTEHTSNAHSDAKDVHSYFTLGVDAWFVVTPIDHVGFYVGPTYDFSISGTHDSTVWVPAPGGAGQYVSTSTDSDWHELSVGLGMIAFF
jgi:hypothetical protein